MEIIRNLSKQSLPAGTGRITQKNSLRDYLHLLKSPNFKLLVLKCAGSYSRVFSVDHFILESHVLVVFIAGENIPFTHTKQQRLDVNENSVCTLRIRWHK